MEDTPRSSPLPFAGNEVEMLQRQCPLLHLRPEMPEPYTDAVLEAMKTCTVFHYAGYGSARFANPSDSCLLLKDWQSNTFTVDRLYGIHIQDSRPFLAYLSVCETKASDRVQLLDESLDLTSAFQLAGFGHVAGTLWVVSDQRCVDVAKEFYKVVEKEGLTDTSISRGLHFAIRNVRNKHILQIGNSRKIEWAGGTTTEKPQANYSSYTWVPYIHSGIR
ncbi:TPR domain-containing protein [Fusarium bulbicola]|nr:TPR domain-containing protein [Fusarium bulbicola]